MVGILGPRQCGKTTLARDYIAALADRQIHYFDLEDPGHLNRLADSKLALEPLEGLIVIDEIQRTPELFPAVARIDRSPVPEPALSDPRQRVPRVDPPVFRNARGQDRVPGAAPVHRLRGRRSPPPCGYGAVFPRRISRSSDDDSMVWRKAYVTTFLERDVPALGIDFAANTMRRFWMMLAHWHGNVFNASDLARSLDVSSPTIKRYLRHTRRHFHDPHAPAPGTRTSANVRSSRRRSTSGMPGSCMRC